MDERPAAAARHLYLPAGFQLAGEEQHTSFGVEPVGQSPVLDLTVTHPTEADRLAHSLAAGGWLVVESLARFPVEAALDEDFRTAMLTVESVLAQTIGTDFTWSRSLPGAFDSRGLSSVGGASYVPLTGLGNASAQCWSLTLDQLTPRILELGLTTNEALARTQTLLADPRFNDLGHGTLSVWGQRSA